MSPTTLRSCIRRRRRCTSRRLLWGENFAVAGGFFLQALLESLTGPLPPLGFHFLLNLP